MKKIYIFILPLLFGFSAKAQINELSVDKSTKLITISENIAVDTLDKKELYINAKKWLSTSFSTGASAIEKEDAAASTFIAKGNVSFTAKRKGENNKEFEVPITFIITIQCKESEYKYTISHFIYGSAIYKQPAEEMLQEGKDEEANDIINQYRNNTLEKLNYVVESLKNAMLVRPEQTE
jgi:hypothetical protein